MSNNKWFSFLAGTPQGNPRLHWLPALLFGLLIAALGTPTARGATSAPLDFRIGAGSTALPGVKLFSAPQPGLQYHVLSDRGATLFAGVARKRVEEDPCIGEKQTFWYVRPPERKPLEGLDAALIVIGAPSKIDLRPLPHQQPATDDQARLAGYLQKLSTRKPNQHVEHALHDLGGGAEKRRVVVVLAAADEGDDPVSGFARITVAIVDLDGEHATERYRYNLERGESGELNARIAAVADINQDGLGDVVLVDFGDYYDKVLLIEESTQWRIQTDDWDDPC